MQCTRIEKENAGDYEYLIPEDLLKDGDRVRLGIIDDDGTACAGCVLDADGDLAYVDWIYTDPDYRERGAGTMLLAEMTVLLEGSGVKGIQVNFSNEDEDLEDFLMNRGFLTGSDSGIYRVPVSDIFYDGEMELLLENRNEHSRVTTVKNSETAAALAAFLDREGPGSHILNEIEPELSVVRRDQNGAVSGCLLMSRTGSGDLKAVYFLNTGNVSGVTELLIALHDVIEENELTEASILFMDRTDTSVGFVARLTGNDRETYRVTDRLTAIQLFQEGKRYVTV